MHVWNFAPVWANADLLALGLLNTLRVTGAALAFGVPLGLALALMRLSSRRLLAWPAGAVIEVFRTTPPLVQLFWFFFALPILIKVEMTPYVAAVLTFSIQSAAFFAEVFRGGIVSVERGQWEAARALGMAPRQVMRRVVLPQAVKRMIPAFLERAIELMKTTTLVAIVSYADLLFQTNEVAQKTFRPPPFHRNVASEFVGLVQGTYLGKGEGFYPGCASLHNCMAGHGPDNEAFERGMAADDSPQYLADTLTIVFETQLIIKPTRFALETELLERDYYRHWQGLKKRFRR